MKISKDLESQGNQCHSILGGRRSPKSKNPGHPGLPMGAAAMAYALWTRHLRYNPRNPKWPGRG